MSNIFAGVKVTYKDDIELINSLCENEHSKFESWFIMLEAEHRNMGSHYGNDGLACNTGLKCWFDYFVNGEEPKSALNDDLSYQ